MTGQGSAKPQSEEPARRPGLRRELRFLETASVSIGVMAPTLAMSVTGVAAATALGRAAPLAFAVAALGVGLVAYGFVRPDAVHTAFAQDLPEVDRWLIAASQRPLTLAANTTPSGAPAWKTLPSWAVIGTEDRIIPPAAQHRMAERAGAMITEVDASHVSMVSHPDVSVAAILAAVAAVG